MTLGGAISDRVTNLSRRADRWLGSTGRKGVLAIADRFLVAGTNFLTLVVVGRAAGVDALGIFALAWTVLLAVNVLQEALVTSPYTVFRGRHSSPRATERYAGTALLMNAALSGLGVLVCVGVAVAMSWTGLGEPMARNAAWCLALALPASALREFGRKFLFARLDAAPALMLDLAATVLQLATVGLLWWAGWLTPATALAAIALGTGIPALVWLVAERGAFALPDRSGAVRETVRHMRFARWLAAAQLSDLAVTHGVVWWVVAVAGTTAAGTFSAANSIVLVLNPLVLGIGSVLLPRAALAQHAHGPREVARIVWKVTKLLGAAAGLVALLVALAGSFVVEALYALPPTSEIAVAVALLACASFLAALAFGADNGLMVIDRQDVNLLASLVGLVVTFVGAAVLLPLLGIVGAALAVAVGTAFNALWQMVAFARLAPVRTKRKGATG